MKKQKLTIRLYWESKDKDYDKEDRERYTRVRRIVNKIPNKVYKKIIKENYDFYKGWCYTTGCKEVMNENEFDVMMGVIQSIKEGYYD